MSRQFAAVEAGGTKIVCAIGSGPGSIAEQQVISTLDPQRTLRAILGFFEAARARGAEFTALGIASFGPLDLTAGSGTYGHITTTTKPGWAGTDIAGVLGRGLGVPVAIDTDVNGAAYGEYRWGAASGLDTSAYLTVGTGIGGGAVVAGTTLRGLLHPEMGHLHMQRYPGDVFAGVCPFHGDCAEGLASGPAIAARTGTRAEHLTEQTDGAVALQAFYLAQLVCAITYVLSPQRIIIGGGVSQLPGLLEATRAATVRRLGGALAAPELSNLSRYLVEPALGTQSGVLGALAVAQALGSPS